MLRLFLVALLLLVVAVAGCPKGEPGGDETGAAPPEQGMTADASRVDRGRAIFVGTEYSSTGLSCAHCHALMPQDEQNRIFIAHSAYGAAQRGAWWVKARQLHAGRGDAVTRSCREQVSGRTIWRARTS
jgi:hypothetical protein